MRLSLRPGAAGSVAGTLITCGLLTAGSAAAGHFSVTTAADTTDAVPGDGICADRTGSCSLRAAVQEANALGGSSSIRLAPNRYQLTIAGTGEDMAATGDLDILARIEIEATNSLIDAAGLDRVFDVFMPGSLTLLTGRLEHGAPAMSESGGAIRSTGTVSLSSVTIANSTVSGSGASGGAIFNDGGSLTLSRCLLTGNAAERAGGAIEANGGDTFVEGSAMEENSTGPSPGNGGALHLTGEGTVTVQGGVVHANSAAAEGGGLWNSAGGLMVVRSVLVADNIVTGEDADQGGGGLFNDGGTLRVSESTISGNIATGAAGSGGGIFNNDGLLELVDSKIADNAASRAGGGIETLAGDVRMLGVDLIANSTGSAPGNGGGLHVTGNGSATMSGGTVKDNVAAAEGGGLWNGSGLMRVIGVRLTGNVANGEGADQGGGGLFNAGGTLQVYTSTLTRNTALMGSGSGGGILNDQGALSVRNSALDGNSAARAGGGIEANVGNTSIAGTVFTDNITGASPGNGGAVHLTGAGEVQVTNTGVLVNTAANEGGGLWNSSTGTMTVTRSSITGNDAPSGPNVFNDGGDFTINGVPVPPGP